MWENLHHGGDFVWTTFSQIKCYISLSYNFHIIAFLLLLITNKDYFHDSLFANLTVEDSYTLFHDNYAAYFLQLFYIYKYSGFKYDVNLMLLKNCKITAGDI